MTKLAVVIGCLCLLILARSSPAAGADDPGKAMYLRYCGACHGPGGKGDGIAGTFMRPKPVDLTQIAKQNGGEFPSQHLIDVIDGRTTVRAHGDPAMPVWGQVLSAQKAAGAENQAVVRGTIAQIVEHLRSIQEK
jgi:mono/diheme cytochrome c family protein